MWLLKHINMVTDKMFDIIFKDATLKRKEYAGGDWYGFYKKTSGDDKLIFGHPINDNDGTWYFDGPSFDSYRIFFDIELPEFKNYLSDYVYDKYNISVRTII